MRLCCKKMGKAVGAMQSLMAGGILYQPEVRPHAQIEFDEDDQRWNVNGCCGGCNVLTNIEFCPYCGKSLPKVPRVPK